MSPFLILFSVAAAVFLALLEIQVEGSNGWAAKLPTWKFRNPFRKIINWPYITGYHVYLWCLLSLVFHIPFFFSYPWSLKNELIILETLFLVLIFEDFLWFVINPNWGIKRFFTEEIPWHRGRLLYLPTNYWVGFIILGGLEYIRIWVLG